MIGFDATLFGTAASDPSMFDDAPASARYHREALEQIVQSVEEGVYSALLGPRLCGKTLMLRFLERNLAPLLGWTCAYINLLDLRAHTQGTFFSDLIHLTAGRLAELTGIDLPVPQEGEASSVVFRAFLSECLERIGRDIVLLIDPLEALPTDLVQALLTSLRAAYMDQQGQDHQVTVVVSGALSLATLAVGESSPFRGIARRVFIGDLSDGDSLALLQEFLMEYGVSTTQPALHRLLSATRGDTYLIRRISQRGAELVRGRSSYRVRSRDVSQSIDRFLRNEVFQYAPLVDAVRLIEEDPDLLECILQLLAYESVPRAALPLPLSPDVDPLYLTGVVDLIPGGRYRLQNGIYRRFLAGHFTPGRVGHVLAMAGRWDSAIDYLEAGIQQGNPQSRLDLLPATINSMYAAQDLAQAVHFLRRGLSAAFYIRETRVWFKIPQEKRLALIGPADVRLEREGWPDQQGGPPLNIPLDADRLEARAFRQAMSLRGQEGDHRVARAIPLLILGGQPIGVATLYDDQVDGSFLEQRERDLQLSGFLNQATRALQAVSLRRQELALAGRVQANLLPEAPPQVSAWQVAATWKPARETSGDFYDFIPLPDGRVGLVIADVVDKGMAAALLMALSRTLLRTYAPDFPGHPERLLDVVNRRIIADIHSGLYLTLFYGVLDPDTGVLTYCNAGHPPPYLFLPGEGLPVEALHRTGMPVGISDDAHWETATTLIPPGSLLLLYTDGISEAQSASGELFGETHILDRVRANRGLPAVEIQDRLISSVYAFAGGQPQVDDITLMVLIHD